MILISGRLQHTEIGYSNVNKYFTNLPWIFMLVYIFNFADYVVNCEKNITSLLLVREGIITHFYSQQCMNFMNFVFRIFYKFLCIYRETRTLKKSQWVQNYQNLTLVIFSNSVHHVLVAPNSGKDMIYPC